MTFIEKLAKLPRVISYMSFYLTSVRHRDKLWKSKKYEDLILVCDLLLSRNPNDCLTLYYRGLANEMLKQFDQSIDDFKKAETLSNQGQEIKFKDYYSIPIQISKVFRKLQDNAKALEYANKAVQIDNRRVDGLIWRASLKEDLGDMLGASEDLNEALRRRPKDKVLTKMRDMLTYNIFEDKVFKRGE